MTTRTKLGLARGVCIGFAAGFAVRGWLSLVVIFALVAAFVLTDAIHDQDPA